MALSELAQKAVEAVKSGKDPVMNETGDSISLGDDLVNDQVIDVSMQPESNDNSSFEALAEGAEKSEEKQSEDPSKAETSTEESNDSVEYITVTDDKGKRKLKVDFNDRDQIKKYVSMAAGMRKYQVERDKINRDYERVHNEYQDLQKDWNALENAYKEKGVNGVVNLLSAGQETIDTLVEKELQKREFLSKATPEQVKAFELEQQLKARDDKLAALENRIKESETRLSKEREEAELKSTEAKVYPVFDKYRFAGKLNDDVMEHRLDKMLWDSALKQLEEYEQQGVDITPELISKEFRNEYQILQKFVKQEAGKEVKKTIDQKKREAKENAQLMVRQGYKSNSTAEQANDMIKSGNLTGLLKNWGKFGGVFNR